MNDLVDNHIHIIGAGPSGLFCSYLLLKAGYRVSLYDQMSGVGKKFLVAGNGGLNLTHSEEISTFSKRYGENEELFEELLSDFSNEDLRSWCNEIGVETFVGSSGRVFPKEFKAAQMLNSWLSSLKENENFNLHLKTKWIGFDDEEKLLFFRDEEFSIDSKITILALGGASWKKTGSDGLWKEHLLQRDIKVNEFRSMNCGFNIDWSSFFKEKIDNFPIKNIAASIGKYSSRGELMITDYGIEGGAIYAISREIQNELINGSTSISIDLFPDLTQDQVLSKLEKNRGKNSISNHLRKVLNIDSNLNTLLNELLTKEEYLDNLKLSSALKSLIINLKSARPIDEAISTSGGVSLSEVDKNFELNTKKGVYISGEMLNWDAPTGGYLLQGCFSISSRIVSAIKKSYQL